MNELVKIFGLDLKKYDQWQINWGLEDPWMIIISLGLMMPLALWFFWTSLRRVGSRPKKIFIFSLRIFAFVFLLIVLLRPELEFKKSHSLKSHIAVLLDNSKSLSIKTFPQEISRADLVRKTLKFNKKYFDQLKTEFNVDTYFVSDGVKKTNSGLENYRPHRPYTNFSPVLEELGRNYENKSLQGIIFFSDGADLTEEPEEMSKGILNSLIKMKVPVYTFQAGSNDQFKDLALESVSVSDLSLIHI